MDSFLNLRNFERTGHIIVLKPLNSYRKHYPTTGYVLIGYLQL